MTDIRRKNSPFLSSTQRIHYFIYQRITNGKMEKRNKQTVSRKYEVVSSYSIFKYCSSIIHRLSVVIFMMILNGSQWNQTRTTICFNLKFLFWKLALLLLFLLVRSLQTRNLCTSFSLYEGTFWRRLLSVELKAEILFTSW